VIIQQGRLPFKVEHTDELITPRSGLVFFAEVMRAFKIEEKVGRYFPEPGSNRGYEAWSHFLKKRAALSRSFLVRSFSYASFRCAASSNEAHHTWVSVLLS